MKICIDSHFKKQWVGYGIRFFSSKYKSTCKVCNNRSWTKPKLKCHKTVKITILSHAVTFIPVVRNENGDNEKSEDDTDINIEEEWYKIFSKCERKLTIWTYWGLLSLTWTFEFIFWSTWSCSECLISPSLLVRVTFNISLTNLLLFLSTLQ